MTYAQPAYLEKIVNAELARAALHTEPYGAFTAYVELASPEECPPYMEALEMELQTGYLKVRIPCTEIARVGSDSNVLSVELREHISSGGTP